MNTLDLECPITMDWLENPICLPCCGKCVSKDALITSFQSLGNRCPLCRGSLLNFNPETAPICLNIRDLVNAAKTAKSQNESIQEDASNAHAVLQPLNPHENWTATVTKLSTKDFSLLRPTENIAKLKIINSEIIDKNLIIPVIDLSGSMAGRATTQVIDAAKYIVETSYRYKQLSTTIITYNYTASVLEIDTLHQKSNYINAVQRFVSCGGTSFEAAFDKIIQVIENNISKPNNNIACISIIFLTDGEDSYYPKQNRSQLVEKLQKNVKAIWNKEFVVHSIGFGTNHDSDFLEALRLIGTTEGAYRYAAPSEGDDQLFSKIISIVNVLSTQCASPITLLESENNFKIKSGLTTGSDYWITGEFKDEDIVNINFDYGSQKITISAIVNSSDELWTEWFTKLIDDIATELVSITANKTLATLDDLGKELHLELLSRRCQSISIKLSSLDTTNKERLDKLRSTIDALKNGMSVDKTTLLDLKFEGQFASSSKPIVKKSNNNLSSLSVPISIPIANKKPSITSWTTIIFNRHARMNTLMISNELCSVIVKCYNPRLSIYNDHEFIDWLSKNESLAVVKLNCNNTILHFLSSIGRKKVVKYIVEKSFVNINAINDDGFSALDIAIGYGFWLTADVLIKANACINKNPLDLLRSCLSKYYFNTAKLMIDNNIVEEINDLADYCQIQTIKQWIIDNSKQSYNLETAIAKGLVDVVEAKLKTNNSQSLNIESICNIFTCDTSNYLEIVKLLIDAKMFNPNQIFSYCTNGNQCDTTALFMASEKGAYGMVSLLLENLSLNDINWQNSLGTTSLWIASCNKHLDVLCALINAGANVNIVNNKGDSALIPACQKGAKTIVSMLIESGIDLNAHNKNRDNVVLICCRCGQAEILDMILEKMPPSILETYAEIDGFVPLLAAVELSRIECIKICLKYGADLEWRTMESNSIIQGANALHLACFYGKTDAAKTLIQYGANTKSKTSYDGQTCLHIAINAGHRDLIAYLLETDPELINIPDNYNRIPIYYATMAGREDIMNSFFTDKLSNIMMSMLPKYNDTYGKIIDAHGESLGVFNCENTINKNLGNGETLYTRAIFSGNIDLVNKLESLGADLTIADDYGIIPDFWKVLFFNTKTNNSKVLEYIDKLNVFKDRTIQNKILFSPSNIKSESASSFSTILPKISLEMCMESGFDKQCNIKMLNFISKSAELPLLSFLDKLIKAKIFPDGVACLTKLLTDAKIHVIKLIVSNDNDSLLSPLHQMAIYLYTGNYTINSQVCLAMETFNEKNIWLPFVICLYKSINSLPNYTFEVYRAVQATFDPEQYTIGNKIIWNSFSICTKDWKLATFPIVEQRGMVFIIKSKTAKDITKYAHNPANNEVIFLPKSSFIVNAIYKPDVIALGQANIRTQTFSARDTDIVKATQSKSAIIVDLIECDN